MKLFNPPFTCNLRSKTRFRPYILELNFVINLAQVGEVRHNTSCNILAVNNNPLEKFFRDFCFVIKNKQL